MAHVSTAPADADNPLRLPAQQRGPDTHAHALAAHHEALWALLLALLAALLGRPIGEGQPPARHPWCYPALSPCTRMEAFTPEAASRASAEEPRAIRRLRAWIGWILRCFPALGMGLSGRRAAAPCPRRAARAPPSPAALPQPIRHPSPKPRLRRR